MNEDNFNTNLPVEGEPQGNPSTSQQENGSWGNPQQGVYKEGEATYRGSYQESGGSYQNGYGQGGYNYQNYEEPEKPGMGFGIASLVLGIISLVLFCTCINIPLAITALIFGIVHLVRCQEGKIFGVAGIITSVLSIVFFFVMVFALVLNSDFQDSFQEEFQREFDRQMQQNLKGDYEWPEDYEDYFDEDYTF